MQEDSLVETQDALKTEDPNGNFYGTQTKIPAISYSRHAFTIAVTTCRVSKGPQILHWKC